MVWWELESGGKWEAVQVAVKGLCLSETDSTACMGKEMLQVVNVLGTKWSDVSTDSSDNNPRLRTGKREVCCGNRGIGR